MIEGLEPLRGAGGRARRWTAAVAVIAAAATVAACGDSSEDAATTATTATTAATPKPTASTTATTAAPAPAGQAAEEGPGSGEDVPADVRAWSDAGTVRLAAARLGTPGKLVVEPKGNVTKTDPKSWDHWYPKGTEVTVRAKDTRTARFAEWAGACTGKHHVCKVKMTGYLRVIGGFDLDVKGAKGLPKDDPALKPGTGS